MLRSILLPFLMRCGFWPLIQWYVYTWSLQSFPKERTAGVCSRGITFTNKSSCLTCNVASSFVRTSPLAVITVVGLLDVLMVSNSAVLRSFSLTICILVLESTTNSLSSGSFCWRSRKYPFLRGKVERSFVNVFGKVPCLASGALLLSFCLFMGPVLKFHGVGTSLMRIFDLYFSQRWSCLFPDTRMT